MADLSDEHAPQKDQKKISKVPWIGNSNVFLHRMSRRGINELQAIVVLFLRGSVPYIFSRIVASVMIQCRLTKRQSSLLFALLEDYKCLGTGAVFHTFCAVRNDKN